MAVATGTDASLTFSTHVLKYDSWSLVVRQVVNDITGFDSSGFEENMGGLLGGDWSATGHCKYNVASSSPILPTKTGGSGTFQVATGCTLAATLIVGGLALSAVVQGAVSGGLSGRTSGTITLTWDESA